MDMIRARPSTPDTFDDLVFTILNMIPTGYKIFDKVADIYRSNSIKDPERFGRGYTDKILVKSRSTKLPRNFEDFMKNGDNETRLIEIFFEVLNDRCDRVLTILEYEILYYSMNGRCYELTRNTILLFMTSLVIKRRLTQK